MILVCTRLCKSSTGNTLLLVRPCTPTLLHDLQLAVCWEYLLSSVCLSSCPIAFRTVSMCPSSAYGGPPLPFVLSQRRNIATPLQHSSHAWAWACLCTHTCTLLDLCLLASRVHTTCWLLLHPLVHGTNTPVHADNVLLVASRNLDACMKALESVVGAATTAQHGRGCLHGFGA